MLMMARESDETIRRGSSVVRGVTMGSLAVRLGATLVGDQQVRATGVQQDSRRVSPGDLFVALRGERTDGSQFVSQAMRAGAVAVLAEEGMPVPDAVCALFVAHGRKAMADAAAEIYGRPTASLCVVGITGTNGKTTTAQLTQHALHQCGARVGVVGTLGYAFEDLQIEASHTSPEADALQRVAREMLDRGAQDLIMEVSSIALAAGRVRATEFDVGVFTNLTQDHLDYHKTMQAYAAEKDKLFFEHGPAVSIINIDDAHGAALAARLSRERPDMQVITVSAVGKRASVRARRTSGRPRQSARGTELELEIEGARFVLGSPLLGEHNAANLVMTVAIAHGLGRDVGEVVAALSDAPPVPGRLERCDSAAVDDIVAVVDYAHTPDALASVLASLRPVTQGKLWCVFGCGGDRDTNKRKPMGEAVARGADFAVVTNDNPRGEDPQTIADDVLTGLADVPHHVELDRERAIAYAMDRAAPGDVVLVAGKGHETYQIIGDTVTDLDDRRMVRAALKSRRES